MMAMRWLQTFLLMALISPNGGQPCLAQSTTVQASAAQSKTFIVGVTGQNYYPQFSYENDVYSGYARELLDAFAKHHGYTFVYKAIPVSNVFSDFLNEISYLDFKYPDNPHWNAAMKEGLSIQYSDPVAGRTDGVIVKRENSGRSIDALQRMGTIRGFTPYEYLHLIDEKKIHWVEVDNVVDLLQWVIDNKIDGAYVNIAVANYHLLMQANNPQALFFDTDLPYSRGYYYLSSIKHPTIIEQINQFLATNTGMVQQLRKIYKLETE